jgi:hypothetical protein
MHIHDYSIINKLMTAIARNVEGGKLNIQLFAQRNDTGWQLFARGLPGMWYLHVFRGAQPFTSDTLVAELRMETGLVKNLYWPVSHDQHESPTQIQREISACFIDEARRKARAEREEPAPSEQH